MKKYLSLIALGLMAATGATSCMDDDNNGGGGAPAPVDMFYNFATYNGSAASSSSFTVLRPEGVPSATFTFGRSFTDKELKAGSRVFMAYTTMSGKEFESGAGMLYSLENVTGDALVEANADNSIKRSTPVKMTLLQRTGNYLNFVFQVPSNGTLKTLKLTEAEADSKRPGYPVLGLFVRSDNETGDYRYARVSFDVSDVLAPADVKGIRVAYFGEQAVDTVSFQKDEGTGSIKPIE